MIEPVEQLLRCFKSSTSNVNYYASDADNQDEETEREVFTAAGFIVKTLNPSPSSSQGSIVVN